MIFYHIQAAANLAYVPTLLAYIYNPKSHYFISVDRSQSVIPKDLEALVGVVPNLTVSFLDRVTWGGVSQVDVMIGALRRFSIQPGHLKFYVNLSDSDFPLWTQAEFHHYLNGQEAQGRRILMQSWQAKTPEFVRWSGNSGGDPVVLRHRPDVEFILDSELSWMFRSNDTSPTVNANLRASISSSEFRQKKSLWLQPLSDLQISERTNVLRPTGFHVGRQWVVIHADYADLMLNSELFFRYAHALSDIFIPDESVFQTSFYALGQPIDVLQRDNCRLWGGTVGIVADRNIGELQHRSAAFARKLDFSDCCRLFEWARSLFHPEISSFREVSGWAEDAFAYRSIIPPADSSPPSKAAEPNK